MGFISKFADGLSGKTYKYNTLIGANVAKILKNTESENDFYKHWVTACVLSIDTFLDAILFKGGSGDVFNIFRKNLDKTNPTRIFEVVKSLSIIHLFIFTTSNNTKELFDIKSEEFISHIFKSFEFGKEDMDNYYKLKRDTKFTLKHLPFDLHRTILNKGFGIKDNYNALALSALFPLFKLHYQDVFMMKLLKDSGR